MKKSNKICNIVEIVLASTSFAFFLFYLFNNQSFNSMQCLMLFGCLLVPLIIQYVFKYKLNIIVIIVFDLFLFAHFVFGEIIGFYVSVNNFDTALHFLSSFLICYFAYSILSNFSYKSRIVVSSLIGITSEYFWEIFEFCMDHFFNTNMQRFIKNNVILSGHLALLDTMKDMIIALLGCMCFLLLMSKKRPHKWSINK